MRVHEGIYVGIFVVPYVLSLKERLASALTLSASLPCRRFFSFSPSSERCEAFRVASQHQRMCRVQNLSTQLQGHDKEASGPVSVHDSANLIRIERKSIFLQTTNEVCWRAAATGAMVEKDSKAAMAGVSNPELSSSMGD